ncbi:MAG: superoxide dismutase [bacterium]|jgi:Fe-Mn family superoxide dismutase
MAQLTPIPLPYVSLPGLSAYQLSEHYKLYTGYVNKTNEIWSLLPETNRREANATYSPYRELKLEETFAFNGVKLHELYFTNLGGLGGPPTGPIANIINHSFGSALQWAEDFRALALSARGWGALVYDRRTSKLHNFLYDAHNVGGSAETHILLIIDVYEHAYFIDYATDRRAYIDAFFSNINWDEVNRRWNLVRQAMTPL